VKARTVIKPVDKASDQARYDAGMT
jgi:hypothetical protein